MFPTRQASSVRFNCRTRAECCWFKVVEVVDFYILLRREGFEGTDLAALAHLECLPLPRASSATQNEEVAGAILFFVSMHISIQQVDVHVPIYKKRALSDSFFIFVLRREGDSNPRNLSVQRFSRPPQSTTLPSLLEIGCKSTAFF